MATSDGDDVTQGRNFRLSNATVKAMDHIAEVWSEDQIKPVNRTDVIRVLVEREYDRLRKLRERKK